eukprot:g10897.t1
MATGTKIRITVLDEKTYRPSHDFTVDQQDLSENATYEDLRQYCIEHKELDSNMWFRSKPFDQNQEEESAEADLLDDDEIDNTELYAYVPQIKVQITSEGVKNYVESFDWTQTIRNVVSDCGEKTHRQKEHYDASKFSYKGQKLSPDKSLKDLLDEKHPGRDATMELIGTFSLTVQDEECDLVHTLQIQDYLTVREILQAYITVAKRVPRLGDGRDDGGRPGCRLQIKDMSDQTYMDLDFGDSAYKCEIGTSDNKHDSVYYVADPFPLIILDGDHKTELEGVKDSMKINRVKALYSQKCLEDVASTDPRSRREALTDNDKLVREDRHQFQHLEEEKRVYTYQLAPRTQVRVDREDLTQVYSSYLCADCGTELRLKQGDPLRCRECGHRIMYKKRTPIIQQFDTLPSEMFKTVINIVTVLLFPRTESEVRIRRKHSEVQSSPRQIQVEVKSKVRMLLKASENNCLIPRLRFLLEAATVLAQLQAATIILSFFCGISTSD